VVPIVVDIMPTESNIADFMEKSLNWEERLLVFDGTSSRGRLGTGGSTYSGQVEAMFSSILYRRWFKLGEALEMRQVRQQSHF
jgi:hypothetical protein